MPLKSRLFHGDRALEASLIQDSAHLTLGAIGDHVSKVHTALLALDNVSVAVSELRENRYGPSTAAAVLAFKVRRNIINTSYQKTADNIVGKMTIAVMDREMFLKEHEPTSPLGSVFNKPAST
jgi:hypothetical protein